MDRLRQNARTLRNTATDAERQRLRLKQLDGFRFRRQVPIAGFVADFLCPQARLIIELDGSQHLQRANYDAARTSALEALGYRVLRYWNDDVLLRTDDVVADIHRQLTVAFTPPQPSPSLCEREGASNSSNSSNDGREAR